MSFIQNVVEQKKEIPKSEGEKKLCSFLCWPRLRTQSEFFFQFNKNECHNK